MYSVEELEQWAKRFGHYTILDRLPSFKEYMRAEYPPRSSSSNYRDNQTSRQNHRTPN